MASNGRGALAADLPGHLPDAPRAPTRPQGWRGKGLKPRAPRGRPCEPLSHQRVARGLPCAWGYSVRRRAEQLNRRSLTKASAASGVSEVHLVVELHPLSPEAPCARRTSRPRRRRWPAGRTAGRQIARARLSEPDVAARVVWKRCIAALSGARDTFRTGRSTPASRRRMDGSGAHVKVNHHVPSRTSAAFARIDRLPPTSSTSRPS